MTLNQFQLIIWRCKCLFLLCYVETKQLSSVNEFSLDKHFRPILRPRTESVSTIQGHPEEELVGSVEHDPPHEVEHVDVAHLRGFLLQLLQVLDG